MNVTEVGSRNYCDTLTNGLTVVTVEMPHIHSLEIAMFVRAGLRFENEINNGISHFLEHMLFRGNKKYPDSVSLNKEFEKIGRDLRGSTMSEYTCYSFCPHNSQLEQAMELFSDFFTEPTFPDIDIEREVIMEEYLEEINGEGKNIEINHHACQLLYKGTSLAMPTIGTEATIRSINEKMLRDYFYKYYVPGNMVLVAAGCFTHEDFLRLAKWNFSSLANRGIEVSKDHFKESIIENQTQPGVFFEYDSDSQIQLQICFRGVSYNHPDYYTAYLLSQVFDDGISSRLQHALREENGLVYSVECHATSMSDIGTFDFDLSVSPAKVRRVAEVVFREIKKFLAEGPNEEELEHMKRRYLYDLDFERDDPYKQILRYGFSHLYSYDISMEEEGNLIQSITGEEVWNMARKYFVRNNLNMVVVGPYTSSMRHELEKLIDEY